jgi:hypothetical protein
MTGCRSVFTPRWIDAVPATSSRANRPAGCEVPYAGVAREEATGFTRLATYAQLDGVRQLMIGGSVESAGPRMA